MSAFEEHYRILGVRPGCSEEELKTAFRSQIKVYHPDRAASPEAAETGRRIIEAYHAILAGKEEVQPQPQVHAHERTNPNVRSGPQSWVHQAGRAYARRMFEQVFQDKFEQVFGRKSEFGMDWQNFEADFTRQSADERRATGPDFRKHQPRPQPKPPSSPHMERAEAALRDTVHRFQNRGQRSKREWCRDYLSNLAQVQILFRDIIVREPQNQAVAQQRLNQVRELMGVIRAMV